MVIRTGIIISSDKGAQGERIDKSGPAIRQTLKNKIFTVEGYQIVPDEKKSIQKALLQFTDEQKYDLIITSGGTGISPRDVTPEATLAVIEKQVPGITEAMRIESAKRAPTAMLSRSVAGSRGRCLIINLPGSPSGVKDCMEIISPVLIHALETLHGLIGDHNHSVDV